MPRRYFEYGKTAFIPDSAHMLNAFITVTREPWVLLYDGGESEHDVDAIGGGLPAPSYPDDPLDPKELTSGKYVRGWINYEPIPGKKPYGVAYKPHGDRIVWRF